MPSPVILAVDDDPNVLRAVARDLRRRYGADYRVLRAGSGEEAVAALDELVQRGQPVALLLVDQRMPGMTGVDVARKARETHPDAKCALLTAYADTDAAIRAINDAGVDHYLMKPWDPPEERLYPVIDDLLADWRAHYRPAFEGVRVVGDRWSADTHRIKDFLARNQIPYRWLDVERDAEAQQLLAACEENGTGGGAAPSSDPSALPLVFFPDGEPAANPGNGDLARRVGLRTEAADPFYDLVIVGGGPAGLAAAVYGASEGLRTVLVEREAPGGQAGTSSRIENYLGFPAGLSGEDLARRAVAQARKFEAEILTPAEAVGLRTNDGYHVLSLDNGTDVACHAAVIATGVQYRKLPQPGAEALTGRGIYYGAATTEAKACEGEDVYVVGAGNSAGQAALHFAKYARSVHMLVRSGDLGKSMSQYLVDRIAGAEGIHVHLHTEVADAEGNGHLEALLLTDNQTGETRRARATSCFVFIGARPRTAWLGERVARDERGFVLTGPDLNGRATAAGGGAWPLEREPFLLETSVPGVFATGDVRHGSVKRVASGVGEGSVAISFVHQHLANL
jgi:thioredoxin reductase (NADPH)